MKDFHYFGISTISFVLIIITFRFFGELSFHSSVSLNPAFVVSVLVNLTIACFIAGVSYGQAMRAERGETENINEILSSLPDLKTNVVLFQSAKREIKKLKGEERQRIERFLKTLEESSWNAIKEIPYIAVTRGGALRARLGRYRVSFIRKGEIYFIKDILRH